MENGVVDKIDEIMSDVLLLCETENSSPINGLNDNSNKFKSKKRVKKLSPTEQEEKERRRSELLESREKKRIEKEKVKEEKVLKLLKLKADREKIQAQRMEAKLQRDELKKQKENEKKQQEMEKLAAKQKLDEEKIRKENEKKQKDLEKIAAKEKKEEAKRQIEFEKLEKLHKQEEKKAEEERRKEKFVKFFVKVDKKKNGDETKTKFNGYSLSFVVKKGMYLAPLRRKPVLTQDEKDLFDAQVQSQNVSNEDLYVRQLLTGRQKALVGRSTDTFNDSSSDADVVLIDAKSKNKKMRWKLLQFHKNYRPPYLGTWQKRCPALKNGRRPFARAYKGFAYDEDSDEEWESEPEDGEECKSDEEDDDKESGADSDEDSFMVDHGYLSPEEEESLNDEQEKNLDPETRRERMKVKAEAWKSEKLCRKWEKLKPIVVGPIFLNETFDEFLKLFSAIAIDTLPINVDPPLPQNVTSKKIPTKKRTSLNSIEAYCKPTAPKIARCSTTSSNTDRNNCKINDTNKNSNDGVVCLDE